MKYGYGYGYSLQGNGGTVPEAAPGAVDSVLSTSNKSNNSATGTGGQLLTGSLFEAGDVVIKFIFTAFGSLTLPGDHGVWTEITSLAGAQSASRAKAYYAVADGSTNIDAAVSWTGNSSWILMIIALRGVSNPASMVGDFEVLNTNGGLDSGLTTTADGSFVIGCGFWRTTGTHTYSGEFGESVLETQTNTTSTNGQGAMAGAQAPTIDTYDCDYSSGFSNNIYQLVEILA